MAIAFQFQPEKAVEAAAVLLKLHVSKPMKYLGLLKMLYISHKMSSEAACILLPGERVPSFIKRESVIAYQFARELDGRELAKLITVGS